MRTTKLIAAALAAALTATLAAAPAAAADKGSVLVVGAGKSGGPLAKILVDQGYKVRVLMRDTSKGAELPAAAAKVQADVTKPETLPAALKGVDYVISTIGAGGMKPGGTPEDVDYKGVANLADAAKAAKVKQMVLMSSLGAGDASPEAYLNKAFGMVLMWKGKGEDHLRKSGVPYTIVRPGGLKDCEPGKAGLAVAAPEGLNGPAVCRADVGLVMAAALGNKDALGKTIGVVTDPNGQPDAWKAKLAAIKKD
jgi:uncharacterized protein YbjT (DUF2867 family)